MGWEKKEKEKKKYVEEWPQGREDGTRIERAHMTPGSRGRF